MPNPNPAFLFVFLAGAADTVRLRTYTQALIRVAETTATGDFEPGWNRIALPSDWSMGLANGVYFMEAVPLRSGVTGFGTRPVAAFVAR